MTVTAQLATEYEKGGQIVKDVRWVDLGVTPQAPHVLFTLNVLGSNRLPDNVKLLPNEARALAAKLLMGADTAERETVVT